MKTKMILPFILVIVLLPVVSATSIIIDMKESFGVDEKISFDYTITSEVPIEIEYMASVNCPNAPLPLLEIKQGTTPITETYIYMDNVEEDIEPQTCIAGAGILSPEEISEQKSFSIVTNPGFDFNILTCKDLECVEKTKIFVQNTDIYLGYESELSELVITATLTYPSKSTKQLNLPATIKAEKIGTYELEVKASKEGYKTITNKIQFGVIEQEANIGYTKVEDIGEIPQKPGEILQKNILYFIVPLLVIILIIGLIIYYFKKKQ